MAYVCKTFYMSYYDMLKHLPKQKKKNENRKKCEMLVFPSIRKCFHMITRKKNRFTERIFLNFCPFLKQNKSIVSKLTVSIFTVGRFHLNGMMHLK